MMHPGSEPEAKKQLHVISHTHWDREWYRGFQAFRLRLVNLIDHLLDQLDTDPDFRCFHLDGQTIVLEDYLEIRPENEKRLRSYIQDGRILIGPWYVQPDEFLASGEAIIRNLWEARRVGQRFGSVMAVGYLPDTFGHISQMPQILRGFQIDSAVVLRGVNEHQVGSEFIWRGADGSEVLAYHLTDDRSYSNFFYWLRPVLTGEDQDDVPVEKSLELVSQMKADLERRTSMPFLLCMDGVDHVETHPIMTRVLKAVNARLENAELIHSTLPEFMEKIKREVSSRAGTQGAALTVRTGELRAPNFKGSLNALLAGTLSSRVYLKQANELVGNLLERWTEPTSAMAWLLGAEYPAAYLRTAWRYLLQNHAHDSISGCSIDQVHTDMLYRFDQAELIGQELVKNNLRALAARIAHPRVTSGDLLLTIANTLGWMRSEVVVVEVDVPRGAAAGEWAEDDGRFILVDADDREIPYQILAVEDRSRLEVEPRDVPVPTEFRRYTVATRKIDIPPLGYTGLLVRPWAKRRAPQNPVVVAPNAAGAVSPNTLGEAGLVADEVWQAGNGEVVAGANWMENDFLHVQVEGNGTLRIRDKVTGRSVDNLHYFEDGGDLGNGYLYVPPPRDETVSSLGGKATITRVHPGPYVAGFRIEQSLRVPAHASQDRFGRGSETTELDISSVVTLKAGSRIVAIHTEVRNRARDHRLRVLFPTGRESKTVRAGGQFDIVSRPVGRIDTTGWRETDYGARPLEDFVDLGDGNAGMALIAVGLREYEALGDAQNTLALTLLRAVGPTVAEDPREPGGQCLGKLSFDYAIFPHEGDYESAEVLQAALQAKTAVRTNQRNVGSSETESTAQKPRPVDMLPVFGSFLSLDGPGMVITAVKKMENEDRLLIRFYNSSEHRQVARLTLEPLLLEMLKRSDKPEADGKNGSEGFSPIVAEVFNLDESGTGISIEAVPQQGSTGLQQVISHPVAPKQIVTIALPAQAGPVRFGS